jgi:uncharacterized membrane protein YsdA (DUF1294 family)/cold shock CspA family protein
MPDAGDTSKPVPERQTGRIVEWQDDRGFGFILASRRKVFVHVRDFEERIKRPAAGDRVSFIMGADAQGRRCATRVKQLGYGGALGPGALVAFLGLLILPAVATWRLFPPHDAKFLTGWMTVVSVIVCTLYWVDKRRARAGEWRVPEYLLHAFELGGGWPGAFVAQRVLRHKSAKLSFQLVFWFIVALHQYVAADALLHWRIADAVSTWLAGFTG